MPSSKVLESKKQIVAEMIEKLKTAQAGVLVDYCGLTVEEDTDLRNKLRAAGVEYKVVKNTLTRFAAKEVGFDELDAVLNGPTSLAVSYDDPVAPQRLLRILQKITKNSKSNRDFWTVRLFLWTKSISLLKLRLKTFLSQKLWAA